MKFHCDPIVAVTDLMNFLNTHLSEKLEVKTIKVDFDHSTDLELSIEYPGLQEYSYVINIELLEESTGLVIYLDYNNFTSNRLRECAYFSSSLGHIDVLSSSLEKQGDEESDYENIKYNLLTSSTYTPSSEWFIKCSITALNILGKLKKGYKINGNVVALDEFFPTRLGSLMLNNNNAFEEKIVNSLVKSLSS